MLHSVEREELSPRLSDALERGEIVFFRECPIALPEPADLALLRDELPARLAKKNVSYYPEADRLVGVNSEAPIRSRVHRILRDHARRVQEFLRRAIPSLTEGWRVGTSSFRPLEEKGRNLAAHASNELVHVDAGAYGATHGDRILRFFVNVHPSRDRIWVSKGPFPELYRKHAAQAGIAGLGPLREPPLQAAWSRFVRAASRAVPMLRVADTSEYDRRMRRFHNWMKDTPEFQSSDEGLERFAFPPGSAWMVFTDGVSHACLEGQHALVDTFVVPLRNCALEDLTPWAVLQGAAR